MASYPSGLRDRFAKPLFAGSNPADASSFYDLSCLGGGIGRHCRLKICCPNGRAGSSPALGTHRKKALTGPFFLSINYISSICEIMIYSIRTYKLGENKKCHLKI